MAKRRLGIGPKLTGIYLIIALPLILALGLSFWGRYREQVERALQVRQDIARFTANGFDSQMQSLGLSMRFIMRHVLDERRTSEEIANELSALGDDFPVAYATMLDPSGKVIGSTDRSLIGADLSERPEVVPLLEHNTLLASSDVTTGIDGARGFFVAGALVRRRGDVHGVITAFIPLEEFEARAPQLLRTGFAHIVDSRGQLVFSSRDPRYRGLDVDWGLTPFVAAALRGRAAEGRYEHPVTGEQVLVSELPIPQFGWSAGSAIPSEEVLATQRRELLVLSALVAAVQIVVLAVVAVLSRKLVRPLVTLVEDSRVVGEGQFDREIRAPTGDEIEELATTMDQTRRKLKRYVEGLSALSQNGRSMAAALTSEALDRTVIGGATELFGASEVWILLKREDRLVPRLLHGTELEKATLGDTSATSGVIADVVRSGTPRIIPDVRTLPPTEWARRASARDIRSVALLPLRSIRLESYGLLGIAAPQVMPWAEEQRERELLELFAGQVSDALENVRLFEQVQTLAEDNARLFERERDVALRLQESLLRMPVSVHGARYQTLYRSAVEATLVGGDFYDLFEVEPRKLAFAVGDVAGKGIDAATLISFVRSSVRAYAYEGHSPAEVLGKINSSVFRLSTSSEFVTVFFAELDCDSGRLTYCSGGHPPALVARRDGTGRTDVEVLPTTSPILGGFAGAAFSDSETHLGPNDTLLLYTDGVSEARDSTGTLFGTERLTEVVRGTSADADLTQVVLEAVRRFSADRFADDIAMLALTPDPPTCETPG